MQTDLDASERWTRFWNGDLAQLRKQRGGHRGVLRCVGFELRGMDFGKLKLIRCSICQTVRLKES